jgi:hypothetical protein
VEKFLPILDFTEIPEAHLASGKQDSFELFARDFFNYLGFEISSGPDRGMDGGRDLIVLEKRTGVGGETKIRWLVSCKHKAHTGKSVLVTDEQDILERVESNSCNGFIGFYSTLPSSPLINKLQGLTNKIEHIIYDREKIEECLLKSNEGKILAKRYFNNSIHKWEKENPEPAILFDENSSLKCRNSPCGDRFSKKTSFG